MLLTSAILGVAIAIVVIGNMIRNGLVNIITGPALGAYLAVVWGQTMGVDVETGRIGLALCAVAITYFLEYARKQPQLDLVAVKVRRQRRAAARRSVKSEVNRVRFGKFEVEA
jgi:hypothetical protein